MPAEIILATKSAARIQMLTNAGLVFRAEPARIDERAVVASLSAEGLKPRDIADALAEAKAQKLSNRHPQNMVIGSDQVLEFDGQLLQKASSKGELIDQLSALSGQVHLLHSAAVIFDEARPVWRHVGRVKMTMRQLSPAFVEDYVDTYWEEIRDCVGGYRVEAEGIRLFSKIEGDYFHVMGFPLLECMNYLHIRGKVS